MFQVVMRWLSISRFFALSLLTLSSPAFSADWPQWRGPDRTGISTEKDWITEFPAEGPKVLWRASAGRGCSAVAIQGDRVFTAGNEGDTQTIWCLNANTGKEVWKYPYACPIDARNHEGGPGATPTLDGDRLYMLSNKGHLHCINTTNGEVIWSINAVSDWGAKEPGWGFNGSPLVLGDHLIVNADLVLALDKKTGDVVWKTEPLGAAYSSPFEFKLDGKSCLAIFCKPGLVILESETGKEVTRSPWKTAYDVNATTPIVDGSQIFISSGYGTGCALVDIAGGKATQVWTNKEMRNHFNSSILWKGYLYGVDEADLKCMDWKTGEEKWSKRGLGKGSLMIADGKLIVQGEQGDLVIANATPDAYQEISRAKVLEKRCWVVPVLSNGRLYCRNNEGDLVCLDVKAK